MKSTQPKCPSQIPIKAPQNPHQKQEKLLPKKRTASIETAKKRLAKTDRRELEKFLRNKRTCLCFDGTGTTVALRNVRVDDKDGVLYIAVVDVDSRDTEWEFTATELIEAINEADAKQYYVIERYLEYTHDKKTGSHLVRVRWSTGEDTLEPLDQLKEDDPVGLANWARSVGLNGTREFRWVAKILDDAGEDSEYIGLEFSGDRCLIKVKTSSDGNTSLEPLSRIKRQDQVGLARWARKAGLEAEPHFSWITKVLANHEVSLQPQQTKRSAQGTLPKRKAPTGESTNDPARRSKRLQSGIDAISKRKASETCVQGKLFSMVAAAQTTIDDTQKMEVLVKETTAMLTGSDVSVNDAVVMSVGSTRATIRCLEQAIVSMKQAMTVFQNHAVENNNYANGMCTEEVIGHIRSVSERGSIVVNDEAIREAVDRLKDSGREVTINGLYNE